MDTKNWKQIKRAIIMANTTAITLVIIKTSVWLISWSLALLSSALDSCLDFMVSLFNLYVIKTSHDKNTANYNYWKWKIQWIWAVVEWVIVWGSWISLIVLAINKILDKGGIDNLNESIYVMIVSVLLTWILVTYLSRVAKKTKNLTIKADMLHYQTDLFTNIWIILSLWLIKLTWFIIIDSIVAIIIWIYIITSSKEIITEWVQMLMDKKLDQWILDCVVDIILNTDKRVSSYHLLNSRKSWDDVFIDVHVVFDKQISLYDAHHIWDKIEYKIREVVENSKVLIHLDPYDDSNDIKEF